MAKTIWIMNHYAHTPDSGTITRHYYLSKYLMEMGYDVKIFTSSAIHNTDINEIKDGALYKEKTIDGRDYVFVRTCDYHDNGMQRIKNMADFYFNLSKVTKFFKKPDIIYASSPHIFTLYKALKIAKKLKVPCICEVRDLWPEAVVEFGNVTKKNLLVKMLYQMERKIYIKADALIFTMPGGRDYVVEKKWDNAVDVNKIHNVNNGVDLLSYDVNQKDCVLNDSMLEDTDTFKVAYTGSIRKIYEIGIVVEAAKKVQEMALPIRFLIYGDGNEREELEQRCKQEKIENIIFKGWVDKKYIPYILSKSDLNLVHSKASEMGRFGTSNNKLFDYFASGKPILMDVVLQNYNIIEEYGAGICTENQNAQTIADAVIEIYNMPKEKREVMGKNARRAAQDFDYKNLAQKLEKIIEELL